MRNKLIDLNNHLFEEMERLNDEDLTDEQLEKEIKRAKSMASIGAVIVENAKLGFDAQKYYGEFGEHVPDTLKLENKNDK